jgi:hypothetical protein
LITCHENVDFAAATGSAEKYLQYQHAIIILIGDFVYSRKKEKI